MSTYRFDFRRAFGTVLQALALSTMLAAISAASPAAQPDLTKISQDPYTGRPGQHATEVEPVMVVQKNTIVTAFQVGRFFGAGSVNIGWATSLDAGKTWQHGFLSGTTGVAGGPWHAVSLPTIVFDQKHKVYIIAMQPFDQNSNGLAILVSRSADGLHWGAPITAVSVAGTNGHWFACDNSAGSPYYGNCYDAYLDYSSGTTNVNALIVSKDGGLTWSAPVPSPDQAAGLVTSIAIQPNGNFVVLGRTGGPNGDQAYAIPSTDGGVSLQPTVDITTHQFDYPWLRADPDLSSAVAADGTIYVVFPDCRFRANCSDPGCRFEPTTFFCAPNDLLLTSSQDGVNWSTFQRIPIDPVTSNMDHFITGIGLLSDGSGTKIALTYYFEQNANLPHGATCTSSTCLVSEGYIASSDGGHSWTQATTVAGPLPQLWFVPTNAGQMVADYISAVFVNGHPFGSFAIALQPPASGTFNEAIYATPLPD
ncbi:MAG TPA: sialidase family protein [Steroidobacteraceae bacterium]